MHLLLCLAHYGEAQTLIQRHQMAKIPSSRVENLYQNAQGNLSLLITGEGPYDLFPLLALTLASIPKVDLLVNLGVAGALDPRVPLLSWCPIRQSHLDPAPFEGPRQRSFSSDPITKILETSALFSRPLDCVTAHVRVKEAYLANELRAFAPLVDKELWMVARTAATYHIPFVAFKLPIDYAGPDACLPQHREKAPLYADHLHQMFDHFWERLHSSQEDALQSDHHDKKIELPSETFHLSFQQQDEWKKSWDQWMFAIQDSSSLEMLINDIKKMSLRPKDRTRLLLEKMDEVLNPWKKTLKEQTQTFFSPFKKVTFSHDNQWEVATLQLKATINSPQDWEQIQQDIQHFSFQEWNAFFQQSYKVLKPHEC
jgi:hypothetical protein